MRVAACWMKRMSSLGARQDRATAGVSYVLASTSTQRGVAPAQAPLPPTVIRLRPVDVPADDAAAVAAAVHRSVDTALYQARLGARLACLFARRPGVRIPSCRMPGTESQPSASVNRPVCLQAVAALVMPPRDDAVKAYLLGGPGRRALAEGAGGAYTTLGVVRALFPLLTDRAFVCLHYRLGRDGGLEPCEAPAPTPPLPPADSAAAGALARGGLAAQLVQAPHAAAAAPGSTPTACSSLLHASLGSPTAEGAWPPADATRPGPRPAVDDSDVQIAIHVRKGVGGTCPARAAARGLGGKGLLEALLDPCPYLPAAPLAQAGAAAGGLPGAPEAHAPLPRPPPGQHSQPGPGEHDAASPATDLPGAVQRRLAGQLVQQACVRARFSAWRPRSWMPSRQRIASRVVPCVHAGGEPHLGPPVPGAGVLAEAAQASLACVRTPAAAPADGGRGGGRHSCCASESGSGRGLQTRLAFDMRGAEREGAAAGPGMDAALCGDEEGLEDLLADLCAAPRRARNRRVCRTLPAAHTAQNMALLRALATALIKLCCRGSATAEAAARDNSGGAAVDPACVSSHRLRLYTRCCRLEMYVAEHKWEAAPMCALPLGPAYALHHECRLSQPNPASVLRPTGSRERLLRAWCERWSSACRPSLQAPVAPRLPPTSGGSPTVSGRRRSCPQLP